MTKKTTKYNSDGTYTVTTVYWDGSGGSVTKKPKAFIDEVVKESSWYNKK